MRHPTWHGTAQMNEEKCQDTSTAFTPCVLMPGEGVFHGSCTFGSVSAGPSTARQSGVLGGACWAGRCHQPHTSTVDVQFCCCLFAGAECGCLLHVDGTSSDPKAGVQETADSQVASPTSRRYAHVCPTGAFFTAHASRSSRRPASGVRNPSRPPNSRVSQPELPWPQQTVFNQLIATSPIRAFLVHSADSTNFGIYL